MDGDGGEELGMLAGEPQHVVIRHVERGGVGQGSAVFAVGHLMRQQQCPIDQRGFPDEVEQPPGIDAVEVGAVKVAGGEADRFHQEGFADARESFRAIPATGATRAGTDDVNVTVDAHGGAT
jgi:hypothetical protein